MKSSLLLNITYEPLSVVSAKRAVQLILDNKATIEAASPSSFTTANGKEITIPYVVRLNYAVKHVGKNLKPPKFQRKGMLVRDNYTCVYCGKPGNTVDHVVPRSLGGLTTYENCVTACGKCNHKKSNKTLKQMGWNVDTNKLIVKPSQRYYQMLAKSRHDTEMFSSWIEYIAWFDDKAKAEKEALTGIN